MFVAVDKNLVKQRAMLSRLQVFGTGVLMHASHTNAPDTGLGSRSVTEASSRVDQCNPGTYRVIVMDIIGHLTRLGPFL